ncbi:hypothetical protein PMIN06_002846 [Paraphaeosphaeria minitans]|uniref:Peroxisomal biogenesis factor 2 n=1 Tax=Paraphaeosphaeria minitans TaxID=565426 RepID=A0A9P6GC50_9PLEO|nr:peroxisomal biogenesis factor 2 [Paraphaeosphaeria minitans]
MPSADFAAAQERIAARRAQRARKLPSAPPTTRLPLGSSILSIWDAIKGREGTRPAFRVGQVDAELLDDELLGLLKGQVGEGLKYFGQNMADAWAPEILFALRVVLFKLSIWNNSATYGAHLQGLRFTDARSTAPDRPPPAKWQKIAYGVVTVGGRYAWTKWEEYLLAAHEDYSRPQSETLSLASRMTEYLDSAHDVASLASFLVFLVNGRYRTITDRVLRLRLTPTSHSTSREVSFEYLNRQLVWHAFTEFLLFLLPLVGISRWRRILARAWRKARAAFLALLGRSPAPGDTDEDDAKPAGELAFLPERTCAICYRDQNPTTQTEQDVLSTSAGGGGGVVGSATTDITNPYEAVPCGCVYCFACIAQRIANEEGEGWTCLRCGETIIECRPWDGDVLDTSRRSQSQLQSSGANGKNVEFVAVGGADEGGRDEKAGLREVDPMPEEEEHGEEESFIEESRSRRLDWGQALDESAEWARASDEQSTEQDNQSEEYDEDEQEEGEELDYDQ